MRIFGYGQDLQTNIQEGFQEYLRTDLIALQINNTRSLQVTPALLNSLKKYKRFAAFAVILSI